jgi:predicted ATPase/class 3 adenylate cyclase
MTQPLPTGNITFLFTDVEGSTRAWESNPEAMAIALKVHDDVVRDAVAKHGGQIFKTVGDAFCCVFSHCADAVTAAIDAQRALQTQEWPAQIGALRVRVGIHSGNAVEHDDDYFGPTVNRVARLTAVAQGGQILLSAAATSDLRGASLEGVTLRDLGSHRLRDLKEAEPTFQVVAAGLRTDFPALASLDAHPNNLPSQLSSFIGRDRELADIRRRLSTGRIVTITGPGGVGKTRLALQLAADVIQDFGDGVFFVALAPIANGDLVVHALASALAIAELPNEPLETTVVRHIGSKKMLLLFDNSEQVSSQTAKLVKGIVSKCANVRFLVTGREPLHLLGESVVRLNPFETRDGARLFLERARAVVEDFVPSENEGAVIAAICRRLDGIPLAIELAASRLSTMSLSRLAEKLSFSILVNKDPTASERHRTLRDAIEWSYRLLEPAEQRTFLALSVFAGGCSIDALETVVEAEVDDDVGSLVDKSLAQLDRIGRNSRYRLLEPIAEFAGLELSAGTLGNKFRERHFAFYHALACASARADGPSKQESFDRVDREIGNIRSALNWSVENDFEKTAQLASDLGVFWRARGFFTEGRGWFARVLALGSKLTPQLSANMLRQSAGLAAVQDDYNQSASLARAALAVYRELGDEAGIGLALHTLAEVAHRQGRLDDAEKLYYDAFPHLEAASHLLAMTICLMNQGMIARQKGDFVRASMLLGKAGASADLLRDPDVSAQVKVESAWATLFGGEADAAERAFREAFKAASLERNLHGACQARLGIATAALSASRVELAARQYRTALREANALRAQIFVVDAIYGIAAVSALRGDLLNAARCCGLAAKVTEETKCEPRTGIAYTMATERIRMGLDPKQLTLAAKAGAAMGIEEVTSAAL